MEDTDAYENDEKDTDLEKSGSRRLAPAAPASLMAGVLAVGVAMAGLLGGYPRVATSIIAAAALGLVGAVLGVLAEKRIASRPLMLRGRAVAISGAVVGLGAVLFVVVLLAMQGLGNVVQV